MHVHSAVKLPEPVKLREAAAKEGAKLSEFQEELVQMAAALNGDHKKDIYPQRLVEGMTVSQAVKYVEDGFKKFCEECEKARESGVDETEVIVLDKSRTKTTTPKTFIHKLFSCFICDN